MKRRFRDFNDDLLKMSGSGTRSKRRAGVFSLFDDIDEAGLEEDCGQKGGKADSESDSDGGDRRTGSGLRTDFNRDFFPKPTRNINFGLNQPDEGQPSGGSRRGTNERCRTTVPPMSQRRATKVEENYLKLSDLTTENECLTGTVRLKLMDRYEVLYKSKNGLRQGFLKNAPSTIYVLLCDGSRDSSGTFLYVICKLLKWNSYDVYHMREIGMIVDFVGFSYSYENKTLEMVEDSALLVVSEEETEEFEEELGVISGLPDLRRLVSLDGQNDIPEVTLAECINQGEPSVSNVSVTVVVVKRFPTEYIGDFKSKEEGKDYRTMMVVKDGNDPVRDACLLVYWSDQDEIIPMKEKGGYKISQCYQRKPINKKGPKFELHMSTEGVAWSLPKEQMTWMTNFEYNENLLRRFDSIVKFCSFSRGRLYAICPNESCSNRGLKTDESSKSDRKDWLMVCCQCKKTYDVRKPVVMLRAVWNFRYRVKLADGKAWSCEKDGIWFQADLGVALRAFGKEIPFKWPNYYVLENVSTISRQVTNFLKQFVNAECEGSVIHRSGRDECIISVNKILKCGGKSIGGRKDPVFVAFPSGAEKLLATTELLRMIKKWNKDVHGGRKIKEEVIDVVYPGCSRRVPRSRFSKRH